MLLYGLLKQDALYVYIFKIFVKAREEMRQKL